MAHIPSLHLLCCTFYANKAPFHEIHLSDLLSHHLNLPTCHSVPFSMALLPLANTLNQPQPWAGSFTFPKAAAWDFSKLEYTNAHFHTGFLWRQIKSGAENKLSLVIVSPQYKIFFCSASRSLQYLSRPECPPSHTQQGWPGHLKAFRSPQPTLPWVEYVP